MKVLSLSFFLFVYGSLISQITVVDQYKLPIALVELSSAKQSLVAKSNINGTVEWTKLEGLNGIDTIYFSHLSYNSHWVVKKNLKRNDTIILTEKNLNLSEVIVTANKDEKKYQTINACFRSYQTNNESLIYYTDGLVEYLTKIKKIKYTKRLKDHRAYRDSIYLSNEVTKRIHFSFKIASCPPPLVRYLPETYFKKHDLSTKESSTGNFDILTKDSIKIGTIKKDSNFVTYSIDDIFSCKRRALGDFEAIQLKSDVTLVFKLSENNDDGLIYDFDNLVYSKIYRKYNVRNADEEEFTKIENANEIFIENINHLNEINTDLYSKGWAFPKSSNYSSPFWEKCNCELYEKPPYSGAVLGF